jgi:exopolyphosphatase/guanosine-5'-triphosphate,3'-diphosphate pyrophosphatase
MNSEHPSTPGADSLLIDEARQLMRRLDPEPSHALQVARLALEFFDATGFLHRESEEGRALLEAGALVHDVGWSVSGRKHHKHSARLIEEYPWKYASPLQVQCLAALARYHRRAHPQPGHRIFFSLPRDAQDRVRRLASLLRIADGLDRSHLNRVRQIAVRIEEDRCILQLTASGLCPSEIRAAGEKKRLFEETFGLTVEFQRKWGAPERSTEMNSPTGIYLQRNY